MRGGKSAQSRDSSFDPEESPNDFVSRPVDGPLAESDPAEDAGGQGIEIIDGMHRSGDEGSKEGEEMGDRSGRTYVRPDVNSQRGFGNGEGGACRPSATDVGYGPEG